MLALKTTLLSLREALEVATVALDKALTAKAEEEAGLVAKRAVTAASRREREAALLAAAEEEERAFLAKRAAAAEEEKVEMADAEEKAKVAAGAKAKKPRANKGQKTAWSEWTVLMMAQHKAEIEAYITERVDGCKAGKVLYTADQAAVKLGRAAAGDIVPEKMAKVGAHLSWLKAYTSEHEAEWLSFKQQWELENPKGSRTSSVTGGSSDAGSAVEGSGTEAEAKPKRLRKLMTQEQKDAAKAKREAKKAAVEFDPLASQWA
jgi:hypothetical protein